ncbi:hypothetical protein F2Q70_00028384 [Brassica cretica]|uniref:Neprosin PEP catalytic domain-containing protein n=1 Tax=Brassica cretica TaxID=69181 RepID=A0A8S9L8X1_BRACR|nr:hypothetical protein F2Q70_00028384 [Brassica cretica]
MALYLVLCLCVYLLVTRCAEGSIDNFSLIVCLQDFDCVEIYKQPAFQHPLLKNHNIQGDGCGKTGCYNTQCPGFVVLSRNHRIGNQFSGSSVYGKTTRYFTLQIFQVSLSSFLIRMLD